MNPELSGVQSVARASGQAELPRERCLLPHNLWVRLLPITDAPLALHMADYAGRAPANSLYTARPGLDPG
jgi:hypothetical protein